MEEDVTVQSITKAVQKPHHFLVLHAGNYRKLCHICIPRKFLNNEMISAAPGRHMGN